MNKPLFHALKNLSPCWVKAILWLMLFCFTGLTRVRAANLEFSSVGISGTNLVVSGSGGVSNATYFVLASTNLALSPVTSWNRMMTNMFSANGQFTNDIPIDPLAPQEFIIIATTIPVTVTSGLMADNKTYDGTTAATLGSNDVVLAGVLPADTDNVTLVTNDYVANFVSAGVGSNITVTVSGLTLAGSAATNYTLTPPSLHANISPTPVTISSGITASNKAYDGTTVATISSNNVTLNGVLPTDTDNVTLVTNDYVANFVSAGVGSNITVAVSGLTLAGSAAANYTLTPPSLHASISSAPVTVASGLMANNKTYDGTTAATLNTNNVTLNGVLPADVGNVALVTNGYVANFNSANVGTNIVVTVGGLTLAGSAATNYTLTPPSLHASILSAPVTVISGLTANNKVYDGTAATTITSNMVVLNGVLPADTGNVRLSTNGYVANFSTPNVGTNIAVTVSGLSLTGSAAGNYTLSQPTGLTANITAPAPTPGLVAAYSFGEGSGTTAFDASGNGNNGTINGATWTASGKYGHALVFSGTSASPQMVTVNDSASLDLTTNLTLEAWVNPSVASKLWTDIIYKYNDDYYLNGSSQPNGPPAVGATFGGTHDNNILASVALKTNTWTFLTGTYDGATLKLYTNGVLAASLAQTGTMKTSTYPLQIGGDSYNGPPGQFWQGMIDEVRVYNIALTAAQIQADMNKPVNAIPTAPGNLTAAAVSPSQINLGWAASTGDLGVAEYLVERSLGAGNTNFVQIGTANGTNYADTGLVPNTNYSYRVRATDGLGDLGPYSTVATAFTGFSTSPRVAVLTFTRTQQFTVNFTNMTVNWSVDGVAGGSASAGTITTAGLYTPPSSVGTHTVTATTTDLTQTGTATVYVTGNPGVFTYHNDNFRTGENTNETVLTSANVNSTSFGKLFAYPLDGFTFSSPIYVANVNIPGRSFHNVVYVATEHDSLYAFDADGLTNAPLWQTNFTNPGAGVTTIPLADIGQTGPDIPNEVGITSTPVVDTNTGTIYVVAKTKEVSGKTTNYVIRVHALDIATGAEKFGGPVAIPGLNPLRENQRTALLLASNVIYFAFGSHGDIKPWDGWVLGYNATNLQQVLAYNTAPTLGCGCVWMSGDGLAADVAGNIYFITGNGGFNASTGDYGDSYLKISPAGTVLDYFTPFNQATMDSQDLDLGSAGELLLPDQAGAHPHEMISAGKDGTICLVDRDNMGHYNSSSNHIVQSLLNIFPNTLLFDGGNFSCPVYYKGYVYFGPVANTVQAFQLSNGLLSTSATSQTSEIYDGRGGTMAVSANGNTNGILWTLQCNDTVEPPTIPAVPGTLHAYAATNLASELYNSDQAGSRDTLGMWWKFTTPVVVNGKVYVTCDDQLTVYGLLPNPVVP